MNPLSFEEYKQHYFFYGKTPNQIQKPKNVLNEKQLLSAYNRYLKSEQKKEINKLRQIEKAKEKINKENKHDKKLKEVYVIVDKRDNGKCQLICALDNPDNAHLIKWIYKNGGPLMSIIDHAHVFGKGAYPHLKYDPNNIVLLNRYSHSMIDQYRSPVDGTMCSMGEIEEWWKAIIGSEAYENLCIKSRRLY